MNKQREELAELIQDVGEYIPGSHADDYINPTKAADAVLAAGYTKPRTINTAAELDALPSGTKLFAPDTGEVWWARERHDKSPRWQGSGGMYTHTSDLLEYQGELTVLYIPDAAA